MGKIESFKNLELGNGNNHLNNNLVIDTKQLKRYNSPINMLSFGNLKAM